jgi:two-component system cell cycle sensor histidine kinase/response regulator CckA
MEPDDLGQEDTKEREHYPELLFALPVPLVVLDEDFSILVANRAFRTAFGLGDLPNGPTIINQIFPSDRVVDNMRGARLRWGIEELEHRIKVLGGVDATEEFTQARFEHEMDGRPLRFTLIPIRGLGGDVKLKTLVLVEDLRPTEPTVDRPVHGVSSTISVGSSQWQVSEVAPIAIWEADAATFAFTTVTPGAGALLGYSISHWVETPGFFLERIHPEDRAAVLALYSATIERGGDATAEFRAISVSQRVVWCRETIRTDYANEAGSAEPIESQISLPPDGPGGPASKRRRSLIGVTSDISRRKQLEEQGLRAERIQALRVMTNRVAHDLNNPLMIIAGYAEEIRDGLSKDHPARTDVGQILLAVQRISGLTGRLLGFTETQAKAPQLVDVTRLITGMVGKIAATVGEAVTLELKVGNSEWALAELSQLEEVILAITSADLEYKGAYSRLTIACNSEILSEHIAQATIKPGVYTCIAIRRDGAAYDDLARVAIFESFLEKEGKTAGEALARAYAIVREWSGDIALTSDSQGSTFTIYLRRYTQESRVPEASETEDALRSGEPLPTAKVEPQTILVVEDEPLIRALILKILRRERYLVLEAASAEEALSVASRHPGQINLLLTDVILPGLTGRALAELIYSGRPELRVVYISGYTDDESVRRGSIPPGSRFLQKPFTLGALVGLVRAVLES